MATTHQDRIDAILDAIQAEERRATRDELLALRDARRAQAPVEERFERGGWTVSVCHHVHTGGHWSAGLAGPGYKLECLYVGPSEADCRESVEVWFAAAAAGADRVGCRRAVAEWRSTRPAE